MRSLEDVVPDVAGFTHPGLQEFTTGTPFGRTTAARGRPLCHVTPALGAGIQKQSEGVGSERTHRRVDTPLGERVRRCGFDDSHRPSQPCLTRYRRGPVRQDDVRLLPRTMNVDGSRCRTHADGRVGEFLVTDGGKALHFGLPRLVEGVVELKRLRRQPNDVRLGECFHDRCSVCVLRRGEGITPRSCVEGIPRQWLHEIRGKPGRVGHQVTPKPDTETADDSEECRPQGGHECDAADEESDQYTIDHGTRPAPSVTREFGSTEAAEGGVHTGHIRGRRVESFGEEKRIRRKTRQ